MDTTNKFFLPISVIAAGLLIAGAVMWNGSHPAGPVGNTGQAPVVDIKNIDTAGRPFIGKADAPVTIAFFSDFQCPYCKGFEVGGVKELPNITPALPDIITNYVETGKVKVVFMDFAFLGEDSITAAEYNRAVWKLYPEKYFEWRTAMYVAQDAEGDQGFGDASSINKLTATSISADAAVKVAADVTANKDAYDALAAADKAEGAKAGIESTPSVVVGTKLIKGAYPFSEFKAAIDPLLK